METSWFPLLNLVSTLMYGILYFVSQHWCVHTSESIEERSLWVCLYFSCGAPHVLLVLLGWFVIWQLNGRTAVFLWGVASRICFKQKTESLLRNLEKAAESIDLYVNANKTEFMWFNQEGAIFTLGGKPRKLFEQFTYLGGNISSSESDDRIRQVKSCIPIDRLLIT